MLNVSVTVKQSGTLRSKQQINLTNKHVITCSELQRNKQMFVSAMNGIKVSKYQIGIYVKAAPTGMQPIKTKLLRLLREQEQPLNK